MEQLKENINPAKNPYSFIATIAFTILFFLTAFMPKNITNYVEVNLPSWSMWIWGALALISFFSPDNFLLVIKALTDALTKLISKKSDQV